ncbi:unnamed protein product [Trichobilharzia regenti]|nr:unnamed protein product [Trichobilharzia regenti]
MDTRETVSVNDQRVANLLTDVKAEQEPIIKDGSGGNSMVRKTSKGRTTTASDAPLSSSTVPVAPGAKFAVQFDFIIAIVKMMDPILPGGVNGGEH